MSMRAAEDDAVALQPLDPAPAGAGGEPGAGGKLGDGQVRVVLQQAEEAAVDVVELLHDISDLAHLGALPFAEAGPESAKREIRLARGRRMLPPSNTDRRKRHARLL